MNLRKKLEEYLVTTAEERQVLAIAKGRKHPATYDPYADADHADRFAFWERMMPREELSLSYFIERAESMKVRDRQVDYSQLLKNCGLYALSMGLEALFAPFMLGGMRVTFEGIREKRKNPYKLKSEV